MRGSMGRVALKATSAPPGYKTPWGFLSLPTSHPAQGPCQPGKAQRVLNIQEQPKAMDNQVEKWCLSQDGGTE